MTRVNFVDNALVHAVRGEMEGPTPIVPLRAVVMQFPAPQTIDELEIPPAPLSIALPPDVALELALALYEMYWEARA